MTKIDRMMIKTGGVKTFMQEHKSDAWFAPTVGGLAGSLLASPEIIQDMRDDKTPQALRRLILSAGLGTGLGYAGGKVLQGEAGDLKKILDAVKEKNKS